jgi:glutamate-1-semialdehyde 2,1-aminomutase
MEKLAKKLADGINQIAEKRGLDLHCAQRGGLFTPFFRKDSVHNLDDSKACDHKAYAHYFHQMLDAGFYLPPSAFEVAFVSAAHTTSHIDAFLAAL